MAQVTKGAGHGLYKIIVQKTGTYGNSYGTGGQGISNGTTAQSYVLHYPKGATLPVPDRTTIDFTGGDSWMTSFQYGINSLGSFDVTAADVDAAFNALITGTLVDQISNQAWTQFTYDELNKIRPQLSMMVIWRLQSTEADTFGNTYYLHTIYPRVLIAPKGTTGAPAYQSAGEATYQVTPATAGRDITGVPFGANLNATGNTLVSYQIIADNPLYMVSQRVSGATGSVISSYRPAVTTVGTATNTKNLLVKFVESTGVATAGVADTVTIATGTFAFGTALTPAAGDMIHVLHETQYVPV